MARKEGTAKQVRLPTLKQPKGQAMKLQGLHVEHKDNLHVVIRINLACYHQRYSDRQGDDTWECFTVSAVQQERALEAAFR